MADAVDVDLFDPDTSDCPYDAYATLRAEAPAWREPRTGMWVITRYDDIKAIVTDPERFPSARDRKKVDPRATRIKAIYEDKGWVPSATLAGRDDPNHRQMRRLFDHAFRPARIAELDGYITDLAHRLIDEFIGTGRCEWVGQFAVPLPLIVIGKQMGAREEDIWQIKAWTDAWVQRLGMMQTEEEMVWSTEQEIEAQHYFQPVFERLRREPDDTLLSRPREHRDPRVGPPAERQRAARRDDGRHLRRRVRDDDQRAVRGCTAARRPPRGVGPGDRGSGPLRAAAGRGGAAPREPRAGAVPRRPPSTSSSAA